MLRNEWNLQVCDGVAGDREFRPADERSVGTDGTHLSSSLIAGETCAF